METVDKNVQRPPMLMGIGTPAQKEALYKAGAETIHFHHELDELIEDDNMRNTIFRVGDIVIFVQANLMGIKQMRMIAMSGPKFMVPGHEPVELTSNEAVSKFRQLEPENLEIERLERRGAKPTWPVPTEGQVDSIVKLWHTPTMKPAIVTEEARKIMQSPVPKHWVRDQVIKAVGHARRRPDPIKPDGEKN